MLKVSLDRSGYCGASQRPWAQCGLFDGGRNVCFKAWLNADTLTPQLPGDRADEIQQQQVVTDAFVRAQMETGVEEKGAHQGCKSTEEKETNSPHLFAFTPAPLLIAFPSFRLLRGSPARAPTPADDFFANFAATSRPSSGGDGKEFLSSSSSSTTSFNIGSSAALPPKKYKSRKTPKHTAITTTLPWIRMVRATCCGWKRPTGLRSCLRVRESSPSWHFVTAPRSHFSADDDGERRGASHRPWRITWRRRGFSGITVMIIVLPRYYIVIPECVSAVRKVIAYVFYLSLAHQKHFYTICILLSCQYSVSLKIIAMVSFIREVHANTIKAVSIQKLSSYSSLKSTVILQQLVICPILIITKQCQFRSQITAEVFVDSTGQKNLHLCLLSRPQSSIWWSAVKEVWRY